ncbi:MAG: aspartyl protease family protein [Hyphomonadaceae bacterium]
MKFAPFLAIALLLSASSATLADARDQAQPQTQTSAVRIEGMRDSIGRVTLPVFVNGEGPFNFVVDTGANRSAVSRRVADLLGLQLNGVGEVHAFTGVFQAPFARVASLHSGAASVENADLPVIDGAMLANADGLLGVEALTDRRLILDMRTRQVTVDDGARRLSGSRWITLPGVIRFGNLIMTQGEIGRIRVNVIIDTGAQTSIVNTELRDALAEGRGDARAITGSRLASAASPVVLNEAVFIPRLSVNAGGIANITAYAGDLYIFQLWDLTEEPAIVLGMDVISQLSVIALNYRRRRIEILTTGRLNDNGDFLTIY